MKKKSLLSFAVLFLAVSFTVLAVTPKIEHLVWAERGLVSFLIVEGGFHG
jgi:hypothetical protein